MHPPQVHIEGCLPTTHQVNPLIVDRPGWKVLVHPLGRSEDHLAVLSVPIRDVDRIPVVVGVVERSCNAPVIQSKSTHGVALISDEKDIKSVLPLASAIAHARDKSLTVVCWTYAPLATAAASEPASQDLVDASRDFFNRAEMAYGHHREYA